MHHAYYEVERYYLINYPNEKVCVHNQNTQCWLT